MDTPLIRCSSRTLAVALATMLISVLLAPAALALGAGASGDDGGACGDDIWLLAEWTGVTWGWSAGPEAPIEAQRAVPTLTIGERAADGRPIRVGWTARPDPVSNTLVPVRAVTVQSGASQLTYPGPYTGTVTGTDGTGAIDDIVFCYDEDPIATRLTITKSVVGRDASGVNVGVHVECGPGWDYRLTGGDSLTIDIPPGTACGLQETDIAGADLVTYSLDGQQLTPSRNGLAYFNLAVGQKATMEITNTYLPPTVQLEKAWFADADDDGFQALFRKGQDGWGFFDGDATFQPPPGFDANVEYGDNSYTVTETLPDGWQTIDCPTDAPRPNGLGTFPYEEPAQRVQALDNGYSTGRTITHGICNAPRPQEPVSSIDLVKTPDVATITYDPGDGDDETVTYTYVVTNTGETALTGLTLVDDVLGTILLPAGTLAPGATLNVEAVHVVDADDAAATTIVNTATATGTAPDETLATDTATARVAVETVPAAPSISLTKTPLVELDDDGDPMVVWSPDAPDATTITYEYVVTNTGDTPLGDITLVDDVLGAVPLPTTDLAVGASMTVTAVHTVTAGDAEAGQVDNEAVATGTAPNETDVSAEAAATVLVAEVRAGAVDSEVLSDTQEQLPAAGATTTVLALAAVAGIGLGGALLAVARRRR